MLERPCHYTVDIPAKNPRDILHRLPLSDPADIFRLNIDRASAKVRHRNLKAYPRPKANLLEKHRKSFPLQTHIPFALLIKFLQVRAKLQQFVKLIHGTIFYRKKIMHLLTPAQYTVQYPDRRIQLLFANDHPRHKPQHIALRAVDPQILRQTLIYNTRSLVI